MAKATRNTALLYVEVWSEYWKDGRVPSFGNEGMFKPADDPPNALFPVMQVECSFKSDQEFAMAFSRHIRGESWDQLAKRTGKPKTTLWANHDRWIKRLTAMIETRPYETVVEQELARYRQGERDPLLDLAVRLAARFEASYVKRYA